MGMLFNTKATTDIIQKLNLYFNGSVDHSADAVKFDKMANGTDTAWNVVAADIGLVPDDNYQAPHRGKPSDNWRDWLNYLDLHDNSRDGNVKCSVTVGKQIAAALRQSGSAVIEFFAVPDPSSSGYISVEATPVTDAAGLKSLCITAYTMTFDQLKNQPHP